MKLIAFATAAIIAGSVAAGAQPVLPSYEGRPAGTAKTPENVIRSWPPLAQAVARAMIEKYGLPHRYDDDALVWTGSGPWAKTIVHRRPWSTRPGMKHADFLEQVLNYEVKPEGVAELRRFDRRLKVDRTRRLLSSRSDSEETNFLAFNLADDILKGNRSVESAQAYYRRTLRLERAGKSSLYTRGLRFKGHRFMGKTYYP